jgi:hypothetical protein
MINDILMLAVSNLWVLLSQLVSKLIYRDMVVESQICGVFMWPLLCNGTMTHFCSKKLTHNNRGTAEAALSTRSTSGL